MKINDVVLIYQKMNDHKNTPFEGKIIGESRFSWLIEYTNDFENLITYKFNKAVCSSNPVVKKRIIKKR